MCAAYDEPCFFVAVDQRHQMLMQRNKLNTASHSHTDLLMLFFSPEQPPFLLPPPSSSPSSSRYFFATPLTQVRVMVSEELDEHIVIEGLEHARYVVVFGAFVTITHTRRTQLCVLGTHTRNGLPHILVLVLLRPSLASEALLISNSMIPPSPLL